MPNLEIKETFVNATGNYIVGNSEFYETYTNDLKKLFKNLQRDYGRCIGKMYLEILEQPERIRKTKVVGYVFQKRVKYSDCNENYIQETWIEFKGIDLN